MALRDTTHRCACCLLLQILGSTFEPFEEAEMGNGRPVDIPFLHISGSQRVVPGPKHHLAIWKYRQTPPPPAHTALLNQKPQVWGVF